MKPLTIAITLVLLLTTAAAAPPSDDLEKPVRLLVKGKPIDVDVGHAVPFLLDLDGDGKRDLLVGQFGKGKLRVYPNVGTDRAPRFESWSYLKAGGEDARVPCG